MKQNIHPEYQQVLFVDSSTGHRFVCGSTLKPEDKETFQGKEYPVYRVSTSSASHPFFTGSKQLVDSEGRVDKFKKRYVNAQNRAATASQEAAEQKDLPAKDAKKPAKKTAKAAK
jgi:large subunit ribosomal protein L31